MEIQINLKNCKTKNDIFYEFEKKLKFPDFWGKNWDAFYDCLTDKDFNNMGNAVKIIVLNSKHLSEIKNLKEALRDAVNYNKEHKTMKLSYVFLD